MRLVRFCLNAVQGLPRIGSLERDAKQVIDLTAGLTSEFGQLSSMRSFFSLGPKCLEAARRVCLLPDHRVPLSDVTLLAPINDSEKIICIGMNYEDHCIEQNYPIPTEPILFSKFANTLIASGDPIMFTKEMQKLDFEVELAIVIGKGGRRISKQDAMSHVIGYSVAHDVSERMWQLELNGKQWMLGKTFDTFCPLGPSIVTLDDISDPHALGIRCFLNGQTVQNSNTNQMIFKTADLIEYITRFFSLTPGDIILSGTPPGVGCFRHPPLYLKPGDEITCEIDELGSITNKVVREEDLVQ